MDFIFLIATLNFDIFLKEFFINSHFCTGVSAFLTYFCASKGGKI